MQLLSIVAVGWIMANWVHQSSPAVVPCTPVSSKITCVVSEDKDECSDQSSNEMKRSVFSNVVNFTQNEFRRQGNDYNSVTFSWNAPSPSDLKETNGYMLKVYHHPNASLVACRVLNVSSKGSSLSDTDAAVDFTYTLEKIFPGEAYSYEIWTLPHTTPERSSFSSKHFKSNLNETDLPCSGRPSTYQEVMNLTASTDTAYRITGGFRRASCFDSLKEQEKYRFDHYRVILMHPQTGSLVRNIVNGSVVDANWISPDGDEYATFTLDGISPGTYFLQVRPFSPLCTNPYCVADPVESEYGNLTDLTVKGLDYNPEPPELSISSPSDVHVRYRVAPKLYYVSYYILKFYAVDNKDISFSEQDYPVSRDDWYSENYTLSGTLPDVFKPGQSMVVEVIPKLEPKLCVPEGYCNIAGTCNPCSRSISLEEGIPVQSSQGAVTTPQGKETQWIIVSVIIPSALIVIVVIFVVVYRQRRSTATRAINPSPGCLFIHLSRGEGSSDPEDLVGGKKVTICIAHTADLSPEYRNFDSVLRSVLEQYFNAEVILYTGDLADENTYKNCDHVVVLYSPNLLITYRFFLHNPGEVVTDQLKNKAILDLLSTPQPASNPSVLFVSFENIPHSYVNELVSRNSSLAIFTFPRDIRLFLAELYHGKSGRSLKQSMTYFEEGPLKRPFLDAVDKVNSITDSGLGAEVPDDTRTVKTVDQLAGQSNPQDHQPASGAAVSPTQPSHFPASSSPEHVYVTFPDSDHQLDHIFTDERRAEHGADSGQRPNSNEIQSLPSSEDSFRCSEWTPSMLDSSTHAPSHRETIEC